MLVKEFYEVEKSNHKSIEIEEAAEVELEETPKREPTPSRANTVEVTKLYCLKNIN